MQCLRALGNWRCWEVSERERESKWESATTAWIEKLRLQVLQSDEDEDSCCILQFFVAVLVLHLLSLRSLFLLAPHRVRELSHSLFVSNFMFIFIFWSVAFFLRQVVFSGSLHAFLCFFIWGFFLLAAYHLLHPFSLGLWECYCNLDSGTAGFFNVVLLGFISWYIFEVVILVFSLLCLWIQRSK